MLCYINFRASKISIKKRLRKYVSVFLSATVHKKNPPNSKNMSFFFFVTSGRQPSEEDLAAQPGFRLDLLLVDLSSA